MNKRQKLAAMKGDPHARKQMIREQLTNYRSLLDDIQAQIEALHRDEWDTDARRREAYNGETDPRAAVGAIEDFYQQILRITHTLPLAFIAEGEAATEYDQKLRQHVKELFYMLHNPTYRYAIVGAAPADIRQQIDEQFTNMRRELWGTAYTLTDSGEIGWDDFPQDTRGILQEVARAEQAASQGDD